MNLQQAIILRNDTIQKQQELSNLNIPNINYNKQQLRTGLQGRTQRRENRRFINKRKNLLIKYAKQKSDLDKYINNLQQKEESDSSISPIPQVNFFGTPCLRNIRNTRRRGRII